MKRTYLIVLFCVCISLIKAQTFTVSAGPNKDICKGSVCVIGGNPTAQYGTPPYTYIWTPTVALNYSDSANPAASPTATTVYTVTVRDNSGKTKTSAVTVNVHSYTINAGPDTTINQGQTITLHGSAPHDSIVWWGHTMGNAMFNQNTLSPDYFAQAAGKDTVTLEVAFPYGCSAYEYLVITIVHSTTLYFFNSFSPNHDNVNDLFIIGNIQDYPNNTLEIYNRYGQKVFSKTDYQNDWDGSYLGAELPAGTYFYILDTHDTKGGKYHGEVNLIK